MFKSGKMLRFAGLGALTGTALIIVAAVSPSNIQMPLVALLMVPARILHALRVDFVLYGPNDSDEVGFGKLFLFTAIIWPIIGVVAGCLTAYFMRKRLNTVQSHV